VNKNLDNWKKLLVELENIKSGKFEEHMKNQAQDFIYVLEKVLASDSNLPKK